jgi:hypothetical protein
MDLQQSASWKLLITNALTCSEPILIPFILVMNKTVPRHNSLTTNLVIKSTIFWDIMPCSPLKIYRHFGGTALLSTCFHVGFLLGLFFDPEDGPPKSRLTLNGPHCVISNKIVLFITTAVRTSNPILTYYLFYLLFKGIFVSSYGH